VKPIFACCMDLDFELTTGRVIANPFEAVHVPDRTNPPSGPPRRVRRSRHFEL
jgi:hypothetical protein